MPDWSEAEGCSSDATPYRGAEDSMNIPVPVGHAMVPLRTPGGVIPFEQATDGVVPSRSQQLRRGDRRWGHRTAWNIPLSSLPSRKRW